MDKLDKKDTIEELIKKLQEKYSTTGQDMASYLEGLLYTDYLSYWDYIHLDTLLTLQTPRTAIPDEHIFIMYHQVTELYFKMIRHEQQQIAYNKALSSDFFIERMNRVIRYFNILSQSFGVMVDGMDPKQFLQFRMALLPASGFQSAQYRMIEIMSTPVYNLVSADARERYKMEESDLDEMFQYIYWKSGATELASGKKTYTLQQFEKKYLTELNELAHEYRDKNLYIRYLQLPEEERKRPELIEALRQFDTFVNVTWPMQHMKSASRYLQKDPEAIAATGGTNWQKYLPPRFQRRIFFPSLWSADELEGWGRSEHTRHGH